MDAQMGRVTHTVCIALIALAWGRRAATRKNVLARSVARSVNIISMQDRTIPSATSVDSRKHKGGMTTGIVGTKDTARPRAVPGVKKMGIYAQKNAARRTAENKNTEDH